MGRTDNTNETFTSLAAATAAALQRYEKQQETGRDEGRASNDGKECCAHSRRAIPAELNKRMATDVATKLTGDGRRTAGERIAE